MTSSRRHTTDVEFSTFDAHVELNVADVHVEFSGRCALAIDIGVSVSSLGGLPRGSTCRKDFRLDKCSLSPRERELDLSDFMTRTLEDLWG